MSFRDDESTLYDPPIVKRGRSASFSASAHAPSFSRGRSSSIGARGGAYFSDGERELQPRLARLYSDLDASTFSDEEADRQSHSGRGRGAEEDTREGVVFDGPGAEVGVGPAGQLYADEQADRRVRRQGRQSKLQEEPAQVHTPDMEQFLAQCYDLTHSIDQLENDIDQIVSLRNMIASIHPAEDVGQVSLKADMKALAALTTETGKRIVALETWLSKLGEWKGMLRKWIKEGTVHATLEEVGEIKFQLANAKEDFADAMARIREGAWKEQSRRERTRAWMARHMRSREPEMQDEEVRKLLKAAELGAADGVAQSHVTSYAGLWALRNPFTELAELTGGLSWLNDTLDREIVDEVTGKNAKRRVINLDDPNAFTKPASSRKPSEKNQPRTPYKYVSTQDYMREKDLEYGYAKALQGDRSRSRKKMVIALLLVIIAALILFVTLALRHDPTASDSVPYPTASGASGATFDDGQYRPQTLTEAATASSAGFWGHTLAPAASEASSALGQTSSALARATGAAGQAMTSAQGVVDGALASYTTLPGVGWALGGGRK